MLVWQERHELSHICAINISIRHNIGTFLPSFKVFKSEKYYIAHRTQNKNENIKYAENSSCCVNYFSRSTSVIG